MKRCNMLYIIVALLVVVVVAMYFIQNKTVDGFDNKQQACSIRKPVKPCANGYMCVDNFCKSIS